MRWKINIQRCAAQFASTAHSSAARLFAFLSVARTFRTNHLILPCPTRSLKATNRFSSWARSLAAEERQKAKGKSKNYETDYRRMRVRRDSLRSDGRSARHVQLSLPRLSETDR